MNEKLVLLVFFLSFLIATQTSKTSASKPKNCQQILNQAYRVHNLNTTLHYETIQEAINVEQTLDGHTIFVETGIYHENIVVNKSLSLIGQDRDSTIIDGLNVGTVVEVTANNVSIMNFTIKNSGSSYGYCGIKLSTVENCRIFRNNLVNNGWNGIMFSYSVNNFFVENLVANSSKHGVILYNSVNNTIEKNAVNYSNGYGIAIQNSHGCRIIENVIVHSSDDGIAILASNGNLIYGNTVTQGGSHGIRLDDPSYNNTIIENEVTNNQGYGFWMWYSNNNMFCHNFCNNTQNVEVLVAPGYNSTNMWDDNYPSGGNYWSDCNSTDLYCGPYQNVTGSDGIGDTAYIIDSENTDHYPLIGMFRSFKTSIGLDVNVITDSNISDFTYSKPNSTIKMHVANITTNQTFSFCRVCIPHVLMFEPYIVTIDGSDPVYCNYILYDNETHRWIYFVYQHSIHEVVIQGSDAAPPIASILSPENKTYLAAQVPLIFTVDENTSWIGYSLTGQTNITISGNTTIDGLSDGVQTVKVYANDTAGNMGFSNTVYFSVDTMPPKIKILSPENKTYATSSVSLSFAVNELTSWIGYSLEGAANVTLTGNTSLTDLPDGVHYLAVCANDTVGHMGSSDIIHFTIDTHPPNIIGVCQIPLENNVLPEDEVKVNATITDDLSLVKRATLIYACSNSSGTFISALDMKNLEGNIWNATIPSFPYCTNVTYIILVEDTVGNTITTEEMGYEYQYYVITEFPFFLILSIFMITELLVVIVHRRKHFVKCR